MRDRPAPDSKSDSGRVGRIARIIATIGLLACLAGSGLALAEPAPDRDTALALALMASLCSAALWLVGRGLQTAAARLLFLTGAAGTTAMVLSGRMVGFGDIAMMLYPVLVIAACLLLDRRDSAIGLGLVLTLLGVVAAATLGGLIPSSEPTSELLADLGFAALIVAVSGLASRLMAASLETSQREIRANQAALALANQELQDQGRQRESLIRELEARNDELQHFTHTVSHDLKSPLVTIGGFVGCLERDLVSGNRERLLQDLGRIKHAQEGMSEILTGLLDLSRVGRLADPTEEVPFAEIVEEARAMTEGILAERRVLLTVTEPLPIVIGDRRRLIQVMQNLMENAVKFSGVATPPRVEIGADEVNGETVFYVRDNGIGIEPAHHRRVFKLFRKLHPTTPGSGVGLALVRRIIEVHDGRVWVESGGVGKGSEFRFTLVPTGDSSSQQHSSRPAPESAAPSPRASTPA